MPLIMPVVELPIMTFFFFFLFFMCASTSPLELFRDEELFYPVGLLLNIPPDRRAVSPRLTPLLTFCSTQRFFMLKFLRLCTVV